MQKGYSLLKKMQCIALNIFYKRFCHIFVYHILLIFLVFSVITVKQAFAVTTSSQKKVQPKTPAKTVPLLTSPKGALVIKHADKGIFDQKKNIVTAHGHIVAYFDDNQVRSSELFYNKNTGNMILNSPFTYLTTQQNIRGTHGTFNVNNKNYTLYKVQIIFNDHGLELAKKVVKKDKFIYTYESSVTYCNLCRYNVNSKKPLPQYKSYNSSHNTESDKYILHNMFINIYDVPVFYTPYISFYGSKVKRKSGFLGPQFGILSKAGSYFGTSYFINFSDYQDLFITPRYFYNAGLMLSGKYGITVYNTYANVSASYIHTTKALAYQGSDGPQPNRWTIFGQSKSYFPYNILLKSAISTVSDSDYYSDFPVYKNAGAVTNTSYIKSYVALSQSRINSNFYLAGESYQSLNNDIVQNTGDIRGNAQYYFDSFWGGEWQLLANELSLFLPNDKMSHFFVLGTSYERTNYLGPFEWNNGANLNLQEVFFTTVHDKTVAADKKVVGHNFYNTFLSGDTSLSLPYYTDFDSVAGSIIYGPKIYGVYYLTPKQSPNIPPEYSMPININETIFYSYNPSYSANILANNRVDMGWDTNWYTPYFVQAHAFVGRSFFITPLISLPLSPTSRGGQTPYVGDATFYIFPMAIENTLLINSNTYAIKAYKGSVTYTQDLTTLNFFYFSGYVSDFNTNQSVFQRQIALNVSYAPIEYWKVSFSTVASVIKRRILYHSLSVVYSLPDCFSLGIGTTYSPLNETKFSASFTIAIAPFINYSNSVTDFSV